MGKSKSLQTKNSIFEKRGRNYGTCHTAVSLRDAARDEYTKLHNQLENLKNQAGICFETNRLLKAGFEKERLTTLRSADQMRSIGQNESRLSQIKNVQIVSLKRKIEAFKESTSIDGYNKKCKTLVSKLDDITNKIEAFLLGYAVMPASDKAASPVWFC